MSNPSSISIILNLIGIVVRYRFGTLEIGMNIAANNDHFYLFVW
jgi:hypothetical protein